MNAAGAHGQMVLVMEILPYCLPLNKKDILNKMMNYSAWVSHVSEQPD